MTHQYSSTAVQTTLSAGVNSSATSITVSATTGFPTTPYVLALDADTATQELVLVTAVAGLTLTVTRGYDNTTAVSHNATAVVRHSHAAKDFKDSRDHEAATAAHGATGAVVGTTNAQTLTNKTLGVTNIIDGFTASRLAETDGSGKLVSGSKTIPAGTVVGTTDAQTLTNKTLTTPKVDDLRNLSNIRVASIGGNTDAQAYLILYPGDTDNHHMSLQVGGLDANLDLRLEPKGTGWVKTIAGVEFVDLSRAQALTNKDLSAASNTFPADRVRMMARGSKTTDTTGITAEAQVLNVEYTAVSGAIYRVLAHTQVLTDTAGDFTTIFLREDSVSTGVTGTQFQEAQRDHRLANRREGLVAVGEFTASASGTRYVKLTASGGAISTVKGSATAPVYVTVERIG